MPETLVPAPVVPPVVESAPTYITQAALDAALERQHNRLFASMRRGEGAAVVTPPVVADPAAVAGAAAVADNPKTIQARLDQIQTERATERQTNIDERRDTAIDRALNVFTDLDAEEVADVKSLFLQRFGTAIKVEGKEVFFETVDGEKKKVADAVAEFKKTKAALRYIPKRDMAGGEGMKPGGKAPDVANGVHPWAGKSYKEIMALRYTSPEIFSELLTKHPALYDAKKLAG